MIIVAFILSIIASMIIGFDIGVYCTYKAFHDEAKKVVKEEK